MKDNNTTEEDYDNMAKVDALYKQVYDALYSDGKKYDLTDKEVKEIAENYYQNYMKAKQIVLYVVDKDTKEPLENSILEQKKLLAESIHNLIKSADNFDNYIKKYSDDAIVGIVAFNLCNVKDKVVTTEQNALKAVKNDEENVKTLSEVKEEIEAIQTSLNTVDAKVDAAEVTSKVESARNNVNANTNTKVDGAITTINSNLAIGFEDLNSNMSSNQTAINSRFDNIDASLLTFDTDISGLTNRITTVEGKLVNIGGALSTINGNITGLKNSVTTANNNINTLASSIGTSSDTAAQSTVFGRVSSIISKVDDVKTKLNTMDTKLDTIVTNTNKDLTPAEITKLKAWIATL